MSFQNYLGEARGTFTIPYAVGVANRFQTPPGNVLLALQAEADNCRPVRLFLRATVQNNLLDVVEVPVADLPAALIERIA